MSGLNAQAKGLADQRSCLFWEIVRIYELAKSSWPKMQIALLVENTESKYLQDVTVALGLWPVRLEAGDICDARRPRFCCCSWELLACDDIEKVVPTERGWNIQLLNQGHGPERWLDHGSSFEGELLPTSVQVIPRKNPHFLPAGLKTCKKHEVARWKAASFASPPYQFRDGVTVRRPIGSRTLASARER